MFRVTDGKGFHVTFANGWTVSVQFGPGNYSDHHMADFGDDFRATGRDLGEKGSKTAEVACWPAGGNLVSLGSDSVRGWQTPDKVLALMVGVAALPAEARELPAALRDNQNDGEDDGA